MSICMSDFAALAQTFLDETFQDSPVLASQLGVDGYDDRLDDLSEAAFEDRRRRSAAWLERFDHLDDSACATLDERLDRDLIRSHAARPRHPGRLADVAASARDLSGPGPRRHLHPVPASPETRARAGHAAIARLRAIPGVLEDGRRNLKPELDPAPVRRARRPPGARRCALPGRDPAQRGRTTTICAGSSPTGAASPPARMEVYADFLESTLLPRASGAYAIGAERYSRLLREKELLAGRRHLAARARPPRIRPPRRKPAPVRADDRSHRRLAARAGAAESRSSDHPRGHAADLH